jgi:outer membrane protein
MKKGFWLNLFLMVFSLATYSQDTSKIVRLSLKEAVDLALKNNIDVRQSDLSSQRARVNLSQARGNLIPSLIGDVNHGSAQGRSIDPFTNSYIDQSVNTANYSLQSGVTIFNGFSLINNIKANALAYDASKKELQQAKDNLMINVILTYLQILNGQDQLAQALNQASVTRQQVERLEIMDKEGAVAPGTLYDLKGRLAGDELSAVNARNTLENQKVALAQYMNVPYTRNLELERLTADQMPVSYDGNIESIYQTAIEQLSLVKAASLRRQSADKALKAQRGQLFPRLSFGAGITTNYSSVANTSTLISTVEQASGDYVNVGGNKYSVITSVDNFRNDKIKYFDQVKNNYSTQFRLGLNIPILNSFQTRNQIALARIDLKNAELVEESTRIQLRQLIEQAYFNMLAGHDRYQASIKQVEAFKESFRTAEVRFNAGAITSADYLLAKNNLDAANVNLIVARYDYILRTKVLDYYQARPLW